MDSKVPKVPKDPKDSKDSVISLLGANIDKLIIDLDDIGIIIEQEIYGSNIHKSKLIMMLFSNLYFINKPSNLIQCKKYNEFKRQKSNEVTQKSCDLYSIIENEKYPCDEQQIKDFNAKLSSNCETRPTKQYLDYDKFISEKYIEKLNKVIHLFIKKEIIENIKNIKKNDICILIDVENIEEDENIKLHIQLYIDSIKKKYPDSELFLFGIRKNLPNNKETSTKSGINFYMDNYINIGWIQSPTVVAHYKFINLYIDGKKLPDNFYEKDDIDDVFLLFMYVYIKFIMKIQCYIISNDNYLWMSLPFSSIYPADHVISIIRPTSDYLNGFYLLLDINLSGCLFYEKYTLNFTNLFFELFNGMINLTLNHLNRVNRETDVRQRKKLRKEGGNINKYYKYLLKNQKIKNELQFIK